MICIVRHGQTVWNLEGRKQGWLDSPLTQLGIEQAKKSSKLINQAITEDIHKYNIVVSPLWRCLQSTSVICEELGIKYADCIVEEDLKEHGFGDWERKTNEEIELEFPNGLRDREQNRIDYVVPNGESYRILYNRVEKIYNKYKNSNTIFICHEMVSKVLRSMMMGGIENMSRVEKHKQDSIFIFNNNDIKKMNKIDDSNV